MNTTVSRTIGALVLTGLLADQAAATPTENVYTDSVGSAAQKFYRVNVE